MIVGGMNRRHPLLATNSRQMNLVMPIITLPAESFGEAFIEVGCHSPRPHRRAVWRFAQFFKREGGYDFVQYGDDGDEDDPNHAAYLWLPPEIDCPGWRVHCIGATCFRQRDYGMAMQWVWLHPYYRRQGLLSKAWPEFLREHGAFDVEPPYSSAMMAFLQKMKWKPA